MVKLRQKCYTYVIHDYDYLPSLLGWISTSWWFFFFLKSLSLDHILLKAVMQNWCANVEILDTGVWLKKATLNFNKGSSPDLEEKEWNVDCNRSSLKVKVFDF